MNIPEGIKELPSGVWVVENDTHYHGWIAKHGLQCDPHLFRWLKPVLERPGIGVVWDIGACVGDHTDFYLSLGKTVLAVEPNPIAYRCLEHNCPKAVCVQMAASDKEGVLRFTVLDNLGASRITENGEIEVAAEQMDYIGEAVGLGFPHYIKLDAEGHEPRVIAGMIKTLKSAKPIIYVEINRGALAGNGFTREDVIGPLREIGYGRFTLYPARATWDDEQFDVLCEV